LFQFSTAERSQQTENTFFLFFFFFDVLEKKSEKTKIAWPKNAEPKML